MKTLNPLIFETEKVPLMIRKAQKCDVKRITEIYNEVVANSAATFDLEQKTLKDRAVWMEQHKGKHPLFIYEEPGGEAAGYASLSAYGEKKAFDAAVELSIYLDSRCRGQGIGTKLMEAVIGEARNREDIHTIISVITEGNEISKRLHERFGFKRCGSIREAGFKFGRYFDIDIYQLIVRNL